MAVQSVMPNLYTADVDGAVAFYRDLLGGTQTFRRARRDSRSDAQLRRIRQRHAAARMNAAPRKIASSYHCSGQ